MARFIGTETEYGIATPSAVEYSPILSSTHAVVAYAALYTGARSRWDFATEHPLRDSRGFDLKRYATVPVVDPDAVGIANVITSAGARFYVDHAHPEYSSPEVTDAWQGMIYDAAGDEVMRLASQAVALLSEQGRSVLANEQPCPPLKLYKNNVDGKGASYGAHENYFYQRSTDFARITAGLIPFFVCRQVLCGAGRVGLGPRGEHAGFQLSQRADYIEQEISLETTLNRGIINTRDEPHAPARDVGRLHVIVGDANLSHYSTFLKLGMTSLVLDAIEAGVDFSDLAMVDPVAEIRLVSRDLEFHHHIQLTDGRTLSALDILASYRERILSAGLSLSPTDHRVLELWGHLSGLLRTEGPLAVAPYLDWAAKYRLLLGFIHRGLGWDNPKLALIDLQYCDLDPEKSLYQALVSQGQLRTLVDPAVIKQAAHEPPSDTRAYFRGRACTQFAADIVAANWQSVTFASPRGPVTVTMNDLGGFNRAATESLFDQSDSVTDLIAALYP